MSEVKYSEIEKENRYDSEFFKQRFLKNYDLLLSKRHFLIGDEFTVTDGEHGSVEYLESGVKYLTAENVKNGFVDISNVRYVSQEVDFRNRRASVETGDILISIKGTLGQIAVAESWLKPCNMNRDVAILKTKADSKKNYYIAIFLMSKFGEIQSSRGGSGGVQQMITLERLRNFVVPELSDFFYQQIESLVKSAHAKLAESKSLYAQAEETLLCELGLKDWQPKNEAVSIKTFSDFVSSGRLDAEYYQSKYDELEKKIKSVPYKTVEELQLFNARGVQPDYVSDGTVSVVNSKHILENGLDYDNFEKTTAEFLNANDRAKIINGDILIYTTGANIGRTQAYLLSEKALASNHVNILRLKEVNPIYAALVLNSKIGRLQTEKSCTGSAQAELYPSDIEKFIIPILPIVTQSFIAEKIQKSFDLRKQSKELLEQAKHMVEEEIEK